MGQVIEFRGGRVIEHTEDDEYLADAWAWAEFSARMAVSWLDIMKAMSRTLEEYTMWMRDQKSRDERNVIHAAERFTTERRIETRRFSGMATRVVRRRRDDDDGDLPPAA